LLWPPPAVYFQLFLFFYFLQLSKSTWCQTAKFIRDFNSFVLLFFLVIRKHFTENPYSRSVELERQVELRCLAPEGIPPPDVTWQKNGVPVEPKKEGSNLIVSSEGHLLVVQARLADMGNYTCVSENVAGKRISDTAVLTVLGTYHPIP
jgi:hypothetical protein